MELEYTIEIGFDNHVSAGYASYVTSTPEEAIDLRGSNFHPDCDSVVRREVGTETWTYHPDDPFYDEKCGAKAEHGPCALPKAHNMGNLDIPSNHQASPTDAELEKQADHIYDTIRTKVFRIQWREQYKKIVREGGLS